MRSLSLRRRGSWGTRGTSERDGVRETWDECGDGGQQSL